jgi:hypothetical protein
LISRALLLVKWDTILFKPLVYVMIPLNMQGPGNSLPAEKKI